jgi:hypothetical protein
MQQVHPLPHFPTFYFHPRLPLQHHPHLAVSKSAVLFQIQSPRPFFFFDTCQPHPFSQLPVILPNPFEQQPPCPGKVHWVVVLDRFAFVPYLCCTCTTRNFQPRFAVTDSNTSPSQLQHCPPSYPLHTHRHERTDKQEQYNRSVVSIKEQTQQYGRLIHPPPKAQQNVPNNSFKNPCPPIF